MTRRQVEFEVNLETRKAIRQAKKLADAAGDVEDALDDADSAGQTFARGLSESADRMVAEIDDTRRMIDLLDAALGDVDADRLEDVVRQMKRVGLTADDVEADIDDIVAGMRRMDDVKLHATRAGFDDVGDAVNDVRDAQDRARGATTSFVGNAVAELPGVADAFGPAGEAVSQVTEGLLEGEIGMKSLVKAGAGMAAVGLAVGVVTRKLGRMAEIKAFDREQVDEYAEAIRDADTAADALTDTWRQASRIEVRILDDAVDLVPALAEAGVTVDQFATAAENGAAGAAEFREALEEAGVDGELLNLIMVGLEDQTEKVATAQERAAKITAVLGDEEDTAADSAERFTRLLWEQERGLDDVADSADDTAAAIIDLGTEYETYLDRLADRDAYLDLADSFDDVRRTALDAYAAAADGADDAAAKARTAERAVIANREAVARYLVEVLKVPEDMVTDFLAQIDQLSIDRVEAKLARLERVRSAKLIVYEDYVPDPQRYNYPGANGYKARGGPTGTSSAIVGEHGRPELVDGQLVTGPTSVGPGRQVTGEAETARLLRRIARGGGGGDVVHYHFPPGTTPSTVSDQLRRQRNRNGNGGDQLTRIRENNRVPIVS